MSPKLDFLDGEHEDAEYALDAVNEPKDTQEPAPERTDDERENQLRDDPPDETHYPKQAADEGDEIGIRELRMLSAIDPAQQSTDQEEFDKEEVLKSMQKVMKTKLNRRTVLGVLTCLLYTSPSPRDQRGSRMPSSA